MTSKKVCSVCSAVYDPVTPGTLEIADWKRHLMCPIPCPECQQRSKDRMAQAGRETRRQIEKTFYKELLREKQ